MHTMTMLRLAQWLLLLLLRPSHATPENVSLRGGRGRHLKMEWRGYYSKGYSKSEKSKKGKSKSKRSKKGNSKSKRSKKGSFVVPLYPEPELRPPSDMPSLAPTVAQPANDMAPSDMPSQVPTTLEMRTNAKIAAITDVPSDVPSAIPTLASAGSALANAKVVSAVTPPPSLTGTSLPPTTPLQDSNVMTPPPTNVATTSAPTASQTMRPTSYPSAAPSNRPNAAPSHRPSPGDEAVPAFTTNAKIMKAIDVMTTTIPSTVPSHVPTPPAPTSLQPTQLPSNMHSSAPSILPTTTGHNRVEVVRTRVAALIASDATAQ